MGITKCCYCGKEFISKNSKQKFCCLSCKNSYWNKKGDRHKKGYYAKYNKEHPERLEYIKKENKNDLVEKGGFYYDRLGRAFSKDFYNPTITDMLFWKEYIEIHDDDWVDNDG